MWYRPSLCNYNFSNITELRQLKKIKCGFILIEF